ncbi:hypothetical protein CXF85_19435 [Colwellia sp. 75C3]|uniref:hypothetical protein n=1 Tax=Colwellia sp. 75C3 TaxID=888425 RepID=UPI000C32EFC1|nr:hypothetical protein [Colwellia sp. 75C3]PKG80944.1 hypothetical protein CXF85_19435 [Colwellia sp. 75C3]
MELRTEQLQSSIAPAYQEKISIAEQAPMKVSAEINTSSSEHLKTDQVTISEEAREKSTNDKNQAAMRKMAGQDEVSGANGEEKKTVDEKIAELQEKIAELVAEIAQERRSGDEERTKSMEAELAMLNSQLLQLIEQKMG